MTVSRKKEGGKVCEAKKERKRKKQNTREVATEKLHEKSIFAEKRKKPIDLSGFFFLVY